MRELLSHVPASTKSELPSATIHTIAPELIGEYDLTPLHLAAYSGSEDVVRVLLNSSGVDVEDKSSPSVSFLILNWCYSYFVFKNPQTKMKILMRLTFYRDTLHFI